MEVFVIFIHIYIHTYTHTYTYIKSVIIYIYIYIYVYEIKHVRLEAISPRKQLGIYEPEQNFFLQNSKRILLLLIS